MKKIILIGAGGHAKACIDVIELEKKFKIVGLVDIHRKKIFNYNTIGADKDLRKLIKLTKYAHIAIGQIKNNLIREKIFKKLKNIGFKLPVIISPISYVSNHSKIAEGTIIMHHAIINAGVKIGRNCIINSKSLLEHDVMIGDNSHVATNAVINGECTIGKNCFIGSGSILKEGIYLKKNSFIKANSLIK